MSFSFLVHHTTIIHLQNKECAAIININNAKECISLILIIKITTIICITKAKDCRKKALVGGVLNTSFGSLYRRRHCVRRARSMLNPGQAV